MSDSALMNTYGSRSTVLVKGEGAYLFDNTGRRYLDAISGISVCNLGYSHPEISKAIHEQTDTLLHCSNLYLIEPQMQLGELLTQVSGMEKVFFSNSGAEANECAIKIARKFGNDQGIEAPEIITMNGSFHGRTMATLSATGNPKVKAGFSPLVSGFHHATFNDLESVRAAANENTVAVMLEPVQGEGGIHTLSPHFLEELRALCDENNWLLILDEIQSGNGRTGSYFAFQKTTIKPDVVTTAKGLGNGVPIGACLATGKAAEVLQPGNHGTTFGGNPLACSAALATVKILLAPETQNRIEALAALFEARFATLLQSKAVKEVRQEGLMIGIELHQDCAELVQKAKDRGVLINVTAGSTIRLLPPFILSDTQANEIADVTIELVQAFEKEMAS